MAGGVPPPGVVVLDPRRHLGACHCFGGEVFHPEQLKLQGGVPGFDDRVGGTQDAGGHSPPQAGLEELRALVAGLRAETARLREMIQAKDAQIAALTRRATTPDDAEA